MGGQSVEARLKVRHPGRGQGGQPSYVDVRAVALWLPLCPLPSACVPRRARQQHDRLFGPPKLVGDAAGPDGSAGGAVAAGGGPAKAKPDWLTVPEPPMPGKRKPDWPAVQEPPMKQPKLEKLKCFNCKAGLLAMW